MKFTYWWFHIPFPEGFRYRVTILDVCTFKIVPGHTRGQRLVLFNGLVHSLPLYLVSVDNLQIIVDNQIIMKLTLFHLFAAFDLVFTGPFTCKWDIQSIAAVRVADLKQPQVTSNWCLTRYWRKATSSSQLHDTLILFIGTSECGSAMCDMIQSTHWVTAEKEVTERKWVRALSSIAWGNEEMRWE